MMDDGLRSIIFFSCHMSPLLAVLVSASGTYEIPLGHCLLYGWLKKTFCYLIS